MTVCYPSSLREEELKNKVAADFFGAFNCIIGNVDFCVVAKRRERRNSASMVTFRREAIQNKINEWEGADAEQYQLIPFNLSAFPEIVNQ